MTVDNTENKQKVSFKTWLLQVLNLSEDEFKRVFAAWVLKLIIHTTTVLGFTVCLALFVGEFDIKNIPYLFMVQALFAIFGSFALSSTLHQLSKKKALSIGGVMLFLTTLSAFFVYESNPYLFFAFIIFGYSVLVTQMNIAFSLFKEELFSPLESERTFPLIESADPIGGILAGVITGIGVSFISPLHFVWIWGVFGLILIPILFAFISKLEPIPKPHSERDHFKREGIIQEFKTSAKHIWFNPFLKALAINVVLQWVVFTLIEFQYTNAVSLTFNSYHGEDTLADGGMYENKKSKLDAVAYEMAYGLGLINIVIHFILLLFQLTVSSKIQKNLGVVRTFLLHPFFALVSVIVMSIKFSFFTAVAAKGSYKVLGGVSKNAYNSAFYVFRPHVRERAKEFLEGIARPVGMLLGTSIVLLIEFIFNHFFNHDDNRGIDDPMFLAINLLLIFLVASRLIYSWGVGAKYTLLARKNLETHGHASEKFDAIEILAQKGHRGATNSLLKVLKMKNEHDRVKMEILSTLGELRNMDAIPDILECFDDPNIDIKIAAAKALENYQHLGQHFLTQSFAKHRVVDVLQHQFMKTRSKKLKTAIIQVFRNIQHPDVVPFLLKALDSKDEQTVQGAIRVCGMFKDPSAAHYLEPFINNNNPRLKANAIVAMWQFVQYRLKLTVALAGMLESKDDEVRESGVFAVGETKAIQEIPRLKRMLDTTENAILKKQIYIALAKMEDDLGIYSLVDLLLHEDEKISDSARKMIFSSSMSYKTQELVKRNLEQKISEQVITIMKDEESEILEKMSSDTLKALKQAYLVLQEHREVIKIDLILQERRKKDAKIHPPVDYSKPAPKNEDGISLDDLLSM